MFTMQTEIDSLWLLSQVEPTVAAESGLHLLGAHLLAAVVFSIVGIIVFIVCLWIMDRLTPFSIIKEIAEEHNSALAIIIGAIVLGMSIIIAAAVVG